MPTPCRRRRRAWGSRWARASQSPTGTTWPAIIWAAWGVYDYFLATKDPKARDLFDRAADSQTDVIISSAGVSVGALDFIKDVVESNGRLDFWRVNMRPGKPLAFGEYRGIPFLGLPGNPVSAFVGFEVFVRPALTRLGGRSTESGAKFRTRMRVRLAEPVESDGRESYLRAVVEDRDGALSAHLTGHQGSGNLLSLVQANALLIIPAGVKSLAIGARADAWLL